jgi:tellurite resistance protein TerC
MPEILLGHWIAFGVGVVVMLVLDLMVFHRQSHEPTLRESAGWTAFWIAMAFVFNGLLFWWLGPTAGGAFLHGYVVEKSLSLDNIFVFIVIFKFFGVPLKYQYRVLFWGVLGAIVMRLAFIAGVVAVMHYVDWLLWVFGAFLIYTGVKLAFHKDEDIHPEKNILLKLTRRYFRVTGASHGQQFFARENGVLCVTPLFLVLLVVESSDLIFAIDSVPAIIGVVNDWGIPAGSTFTFIAFTSNVFAILGLRALYFLLAGVMGMFRYLSLGLSGVLAFVGFKMVADYWVPRLLEMEEFHLMPGWASMLVIFGILGVAIVASIIAERREKRIEEV